MSGEKILAAMQTMDQAAFLNRQRKLIELTSARREVALYTDRLRRHTKAPVKPRDCRWARQREKALLALPVAALVKVRVAERGRA